MQASPEHAPILKEAEQLCAAGNHAAALVLLDAARKKQSAPEILARMGEIFHQMGKADAAIQMLIEGLKAHPLDTLLTLQLANYAYQANMPQRALPYTTLFVQRQDCPAEILLTHAHLLRLAGEEEKAGTFYKTLLSKQPKNIGALASLGSMALDACNYEEAARHFQHAAKLDPKNTHVAMQLANTAFRMGDLPLGWKSYEARFGFGENDGLVKKRPFPQHQWRGEYLYGKTLLVWGEQGAGEEMLYATMLEDAAKRCGSLLVECDPRLQALFTRSFPDMTFIARSDPPDARLLDAGIAAQCSMGQLGAFLRPSFKSFPRKPHLLVADENARQALRSRYEAEKEKRGLDGLIIGLSWKSKPLRHGDPKSTSLADWSPHLTGAPHLFISLQYGDISEEMRMAQEKGWNLLADSSVDQGKDLDAFAAQVAAMDAVITVSNTTAHMTGALGAHMLLLLPKSRGLMWHWFDDMNSSPWYSGTQIIRQSTDGDWNDILDAMGSGIKELRT